ncbi:hypothetical protein BJ138DRAFT_1183844, partial [Hygrophoropsis aurantiaca]
MSQRPSRANANKNPAKVILDSTQRRRTSTQKKADDEAATAKKAAREEDSRKKDQKNINAIAAAEDLLRKEDAHYGTVPSQSFRASLKKRIPKESSPDKKSGGNDDAAAAITYESDGDDDFNPDANKDDTETDDASTEMSGTYSDDINAEETKKKKAKGKRGPKQRSMRDAIDAARSVPALSGAQNKKRKESDRDNGTEHAAVQAKRSKGTYASNLEADWRKKLGAGAKKSMPKKTVSTAENDEPGLIPSIVDRSRSSSRTSFSRATGASSEDPNTGGMFDEDESAETLEIARKTKVAEPKQPKNADIKPTVTARTTSQMGVKIQKMDVNDAVKEAKEPTSRGKPLKGLKASDLPFTDDSDHKVWDSLVRALLDWAGTVDDPFGTNEHPDLARRLQELWDHFFPHLELEISDYPAVKKLATDRLNDWRSQFGKNALARLEKFFKDPKYRNDSEARAEYVQAQLPQVVRGKNVVPFLYADSARLTKSWQAPLLIDILAWHVKRVGNSFQ